MSAHVPDPASSNVQQAVVVCRGLQHKHSCAPIWDSDGTIIFDDNVVKAATGEIVLTAIMLDEFRGSPGGWLHATGVQAGVTEWTFIETRDFDTPAGGVVPLPAGFDLETQTGGSVDRRH